VCVQTQDGYASSGGWGGGRSEPRWIIRSLKDADPSTFENLGGGYGKDKERVYWLDKTVEQADSGSFVHIEGGVGKDSRHVFIRTEVIKGVDPETFRKVPGKGYGYYVDKDAVLKSVSHGDDGQDRLERVDGVDRDTLHWVDGKHLRDKDHCYDTWNGPRAVPDSECAAADVSENVDLDQVSWNRYINTRIGFEMAYPFPEKEWQVNEDGNSVIIERLAENFVDIEVRVTLSSRPAEEELRRFFQQPSSRPPTSESPQEADKTVIDGHNGYEVGNGGGGSAGGTVFLERDARSSFAIDWSFFNSSTDDPSINAKLLSEEQYFGIVDRMVRSFRFVDHSPKR
jgi:hypothetical protein